MAKKPPDDDKDSEKKAEKIARKARKKAHRLSMYNRRMDRLLARDGEGTPSPVTVRLLKRLTDKRGKL